MDRVLPPLEDVLGKLPWYADLTQQHRGDLLAEVQSRLGDNASREEYAGLLEQWALVAHVDAKWARFELLRESGLLAA